jgi:putative component of membrane protein insertase Oxa1/YidC/SpoIIIJ protein YidD
MSFAQPSLPIENKLALLLVEFYRRNLSPLKGFSCACGRMGYRTCSTMGKRLLKHYPLQRAIGYQLKQFERCAKMARIQNFIRASNTDAQNIIRSLIIDFDLTPYQAAFIFGAAQGAGTMVSGGQGCKGVCGCMPEACSEFMGGWGCKKDLCC